MFWIYFQGSSGQAKDVPSFSQSIADVEALQDGFVSVLCLSFPFGFWGQTKKLW
jgi:hypothetical protein